MKTIKDLQLMKKTQCTPFKNSYEFFILQLEDFYIAKINGLERIYDNLQEWDFPSKNYIINDLISCINESSIEGFDEIKFRKQLLK